ncbi:polysaccharide deacetylase family protein [Streptomonospora wellingtoniae]|uniref:Polysaccharide deacetylase family protein n=1 Tax=Streptomonospora wellingtoniae TaxID=3075544 RepID=A0ABU2KV54_9ACTN|nr:polysaccharide deacetylase family protein [Streptomonospora sp. DSM 45055]MDT0303052.1 polysaccharide deacetylase family protein [Streptomonospora sp. DSM 45055]
MSDGTSPKRGRVVATLLTIGLTVFAAAAPAHAAPQDNRYHPAAGAKGTATPEVVTQTGVPGQSVALTFDDGPNPGETPRLLDVLRRHDVKAVFCLWGQHAQQHPDLVRQIADAGHTLCNHSMYHADLASQSWSSVAADLEATNQAIHDAVPSADIPYFRAPYGSWGQSPQVAAEMGMQPLGWSLAVEDWNTPGTQVLADRLRQGITRQSVVLLHDGGGDRSQTIEAVDRVVPELQSQGWRFVRPATRG